MVSRAFFFFFRGPVTCLKWTCLFLQFRAAAPPGAKGPPRQNFSFDRVVGPEDGQAQVYETVEPYVAPCFDLCDDLKHAKNVGRNALQPRRAIHGRIQRDGPGIRSNKLR